ncbi:MAG: DUF296 domain-containing protein [Candidatus Diapherotrites archaeon]|nr:DUF296 domain-containing protein [Candidatus Diapherotrites archaeon]
MEYKQLANIIFIRLHSGEDLFEGLHEVCKKCKVRTAIVLSAVGMLQDFELGYFKAKGNYTKQRFKKPHELVALSGIIMKLGREYNFHLHAALGNEKKKLIGGHLISAKVKVTAELVLLKSNATLHRILDEETGLLALKL